MAKVVQIEEAAARFCAQANCPNPYLALTSLTGPDEAWWINGFDSVDTMEKVRQSYASNTEITQRLNDVAEQKADLVFPSVNLVARFHPEMSSYTTQIAPRLFLISVVQVRPGHVAAFRDIRTRVKAILEHAGRPQWVYQVTSGTKDVTFLVMTPAHTMQEIQTTPQPDDAGNDIIVSSETRLYAVSPTMSMPSEAWKEADPDFWKRP
jgi:hypothetical protein